MNITYNQALQFIDSERERGILNQSIIREINSIRIYFDYLLESGIINQNIIKRIRIRQSGRKVLPETLSPQAARKYLPELYKPSRMGTLDQNGKATCTKGTWCNIRFIVYQGLDSGEIARLETGHINLAEGKIYIPSGRKSNARTLKLQANQILPIKTYMEANL